jgi:two-component system response regulator AtoC
LQAKLLRALQEKQIRRVGGTKEINVDVRVVAATNRDLLKMSQDGRFREDLYYRLNVLSIEIPPLRERRSDIPVLIDYFLKKHTRNSDRKINGLDAEAKNFCSITLSGQRPPARIGNRTRRSACAKTTRLRSKICRRKCRTESLAPASATARADLFKLPAEGINFEEVERGLIMQAMERTDYNITKSAKLLGLTFRTLQYRLEKFGIKKKPTERKKRKNSAHASKNKEQKVFQKGDQIGSYSLIEKLGKGAFGKSGWQKKKQRFLRTVSL